MAEKESRGKCQFCGELYAKRSMSKHLLSCKKRFSSIENANTGKAKEDTLYHLVIQDKYAKDFWLHLEMTGTAKLKTLDNYLREIWLECCGHMSEFSLDGWGSAKVAMTTSAKTIFQKTAQLEYIYDFGTSSEIVIKVIAQREAKPLSKHPLLLMARNEMPLYSCMECGKPAHWLCNECIYEHEESGLLCDQHVKKHPHDNYGEPLKLVNSPRMGMCGYDGPAEPPY